VVVRFTVVSRDGSRYRSFVLYDPALANSGRQGDDARWTSTGPTA